MSSDPSAPNPLPVPTPLSVEAARQKNLGGPRPGVTGANEKLIVYRHSNLFYWWPVWAFGFLFALITWFDNTHLAIVPADTVALEQREIVDIDGKGTKEVRDVLILHKSRRHLTRANETGVQEVVQPTILVTHYKQVGTIYLIILMLVIMITNVTLRGLWSVLMIVSIIMMLIIISVAGWWDFIFLKISQGRGIYINLGGYILVSTVLFALWLVSIFFFDRQTYMVFTAGQLRVRLEIGGEETVYDTISMVIQKERGDLFRHWILGFGSGDLIIKPAGQPHPLLFPNVLRVGTIVARIQQLAKEKVIVK